MVDTINWHEMRNHTYRDYIYPDAPHGYYVSKLKLNNLSSVLNIAYNSIDVIYLVELLKLCGIKVPKEEGNIIIDMEYVCNGFNPIITVNNCTQGWYKLKKCPEEIVNNYHLVIPPAYTHRPDGLGVHLGGIEMLFDSDDSDDDELQTFDFPMIEGKRMFKETCSNADELYYIFHKKKSTKQLTKILNNYKKGLPLEYEHLDLKSIEGGYVRNVYYRYFM